jgi:hypothetical protein
MLSVVNAECHFAADYSLNCLIMLNCFMLNVALLSVVKLSVVSWLSVDGIF